MGRQYSQPTPFRDRQCPYCGFWFTPQGLSGHIRFRHGKTQPQPRLGILESKDIAQAKQLLANAQFQKKMVGEIGEDTKVKLFERVLIELGEQLFGDKAIPLERLNEIFALKLRKDRIKKMELLADKAEAEAREIRERYGKT
ncbi:hypothetical protein M1N58_01185 [Dehalococcoidales bacterium]|nr:hypothetical protein [Dehalococcoidales bacterium]